MYQRLYHSVYGIFLSSFFPQDTLEEASALLKEIEARDSRQVPQSTGTSDSKQSSETSSDTNTQQSNLDRLEG